MPFPSETFLDRMRSTFSVAASEFEHLYAQVEGFLRTEHKDTGAHGDVTADSVTVAGETTTDTLSATGSGPHTIGSVTVTATGAQEDIQLGGDTDGWILSRRTQTGVDTSGYGLKAYDLAFPSFAVVQLAYYTSGGYYWVQPHDQKGVALGYKDGSSSDRIKYLAVQDGVYEKGRTAAAGDWTDYTPTFASSGTQPTNYTVTGRYAQIGNTVHVVASVVCGASWTAGTGSYTLALPLTSVAVSNAVAARGSALVFDNSTGDFYTAVARQTSTTATGFILPAAAGAVGAAAPITFAASDQIGVSLTYEVA